MPDGHLPFDVADHDTRVQRGTWIYYVRAVRRGESLGGGRLDGLEGVLLTAAFLVVFGRLLERWQVRQPWKVGVIRIAGDRWGATGRITVVHQELVRAEDVPTARLAELAAQVREGAFPEP